MKIKPLRKDVSDYLRAHGLLKKWGKARKFFEHDSRHPSLHTELMEPRWRGIYSFRIDKYYRALFFINKKGAEVCQITKHYRK